MGISHKGTKAQSFTKFFFVVLLRGLVFLWQKNIYLTINII